MSILLALILGIDLVIHTVSEPAGAMIVFTPETGTVLAPVVERLPANMQMPMELPCRAPLGAVIIRWASGAQVTLPAVQFCLSDGRRQTLTVLRPLGVRGADLDERYAAYLRRAPAMSAQQRGLFERRFAADVAALGSVVPAAGWASCISVTHNKTLRTTC